MSYPDYFTAASGSALLARTAEYLDGVEDFVCDIINLDIGHGGLHTLLTLATPKRELVSPGTGSTLQVGAFSEGNVFATYKYARTTWLRDPETRPRAATAVRALGSAMAGCPRPIIRAAGSELDNPDTEVTSLGIEAVRAGNTREQKELAGYLASLKAQEKRPNSYTFAREQREGRGKRYFYAVRFGLYEA